MDGCVLGVTHADSFVGGLAAVVSAGLLTAV
jgi:hypothetical protein